MKKLLSVILTLALIVGLLSVCAISASAAEAGTLTSNAIVLSAGKWRTKYWTSQNDDLNCYNKIVVPSRGYITFTATKPFDDEGEICAYNLVLYNTSGQVVWAADTEPQADSFSDVYTYKVGLNKGTYYMNVKADFYVYSTSAPIKTQYKYTFTKNNYWEIESNNDASKANVIKLGTKYYGVYADESYDTSYRDYYKFYLTKGRTYNVYLYNYNALDAGTMIEDILDPYGTELDFDYDDYKDVGNARCWTFKAKYTGWYYLRMDNDGNEIGTSYQVKVEQRKIPASSCTFKLSAKSYTYNGKVKTPSVTVKNASGKVLKKGTDYTVTYAKGRKNVGTYKVTIKMKGNYSGSKTLSFSIYPPKTSVYKVVGKSKGFVVAINKKTTQVAGYQVQYSAFKSFYKSKTKTISGSKNTKSTITGLGAKKTYYVRVRTYKKVGNTIYYSAWSYAKSTKTK